MSKKDSLGNRMKHNYEEVSKIRLLRRTPVIIRLDGKAFHTFTRGFKKPFDEIFMRSMRATMKYLCENIQGCVLGYTQSDEITLVLVDYKKLDSDAWFDYEVQKLCSISASMATLAFNKALKKYRDNYDFVAPLEEFDGEQKYLKTLERALDKGAMFDSRCFNIPKEEVANCLLWRQQDATRNSVQMVAQAVFPHKQLEYKNCNQLQDMLFIEKGINWDKFPTYQKRGSCCIKDENGKWYIDLEIPRFVNDGREYVEKLIKKDVIDG